MSHEIDERGYPHVENGRDQDCRDCQEDMMTLLDGGPFTPAAKRNIDRHRKVIRLELQILDTCPWLKHPFLRFVESFWVGLVQDPRDLLTPRWGGLTFGWLNDGMKPTVWHTIRQLTHDQTDPYTGIYPSGAPRSLAEAQAWDRELADKRERERWSGYATDPLVVDCE